MVISFPFGDPLAHLIPEESVNSVSLVLRKAHPSGVVCVHGKHRNGDPSGLGPAAQTLPLGLRQEEMGDEHFSGGVRS